LQHENNGNPEQDPREFRRRPGYDAAGAEKGEYIDTKMRRAARQALRHDLRHDGDEMTDPIAGLIAAKRAGLRDAQSPQSGFALPHQDGARGRDRGFRASVCSGSDPQLTGGKMSPLRRALVIGFELLLVAGGLAALIWQLDQPRFKPLWVSGAGVWVALGLMLLWEDIFGSSHPIFGPPADPGIIAGVTTERCEPLRTPIK
jgi:hypothetical protein